MLLFCARRTRPALKFEREETILEPVIWVARGFVVGIALPVFLLGVNKARRRLLTKTMHYSRLRVPAEAANAHFLFLGLNPLLTPMRKRYRPDSRKPQASFLKNGVRWILSSLANTAIALKLSGPSLVSLEPVKKQDIHHVHGYSCSTPRYERPKYDTCYGTC